MVCPFYWTTDDLDENGHLSCKTDEPLSVVAKLVNAVEQDQLAEQATTGYALILALRSPSMLTICRGLWCWPIEPLRHTTPTVVRTMAIREHFAPVC